MEWFPPMEKIEKLNINPISIEKIGHDYHETYGENWFNCTLMYDIDGNIPDQPKEFVST